MSRSHDHEEHTTDRADAPASTRAPAHEIGNPTWARIAGLQRTAGNAAVAHSLGAAAVQRAAIQRAAIQRAPVQRSPDAKPGDIDQAGNDLYGWLVANTPQPERVLMTLLLQKDHRDALSRAYLATHKRSLESDLSALGAADAVRARSYLKYGGLRTADRIYLAIHGLVTDITTVKRVLPEVRAGRAAAEEDFRNTYKEAYPTDTELPNGEKSRIGGALSQEMMWARFSERFEAFAVLAFGTPRAADEVKIATVDGPTGVIDARLFSALQKPDLATLRSQFEASYHRPLKDYLDKELFLHTRLRALMLVDEKVKPEDRLIETVKIATSGYTTADFDFIRDAARTASPEQVIAFKKAMEAGDPRLASMRATLGGMNAEQADQLNALLNVDTSDAALNDPAVKMLRRETGTDAELMFDVLRNSNGAPYEVYRAAYLDVTSPLRGFVDHYISPPQKGLLLNSVFIQGKTGFDALKARLRFVMTDPGHDDYIVFLLSSAATGAERTALARDTEFGGWLGALSTALRNRLLIVMKPESMSPQDRAVWIDAAVKRETADGVGSLTKASDALADENRELQAARARIAATGRAPTADEEKELSRLGDRTESALSAFIAYREQFEAAVASLVEVAASLVATLATGGASVELMVMAMARAAVAGAMAKVVSRKVVLGDRFDVMGADGAAAFVSGAVEGALNVLGGAAAKQFSGAALEEAAAMTAATTARTGTPAFVSGTGAKLAEGAFTGGVQAAVDTAVSDRTWADGFDRGMGRLFSSTVQGAAMGGLPPALGMALAGYSTLEAFSSAVDALPPGVATLEIVEVPSAPSTTPTPPGSPGPPVQREPNWGSAYEQEVDRMARLGTLDKSLPPMTFMLPGAHNHLDNGIDRIGVVLQKDGTLKVFHFEMKWRLPPADGGSLPTVKLNIPEKLGSVQVGQHWTANAIELLCVNDTSQAIAVRNHVATMLSMTSGRPLSAVHDDEVRAFLRGSLNSPRIIVIPTHVDDKFLMKQIAALYRWGITDITVAKTPTPKMGRR